ncbi:MAG: AAA family ATPase [Pseudomonadota bacterium]
MIHTFAVEGYRSLRSLVVPLAQLTVVTGPNGSGKTSLYRALGLLRDLADDRIMTSIARDGGFETLMWAGPETISRAMKAGDVPIQGTTRKDRVALKIGIADDTASYAAELGLPAALAGSFFNQDPEIKAETFWYGERPSPSRIIASRRAKFITKVGHHDDESGQSRPLESYESMLRNAVSKKLPWEVSDLQSQIRAWVFYDHFRVDPDAPARQFGLPTRAVRLDPDGGNLSSAIATILEIGNAEALAGEFEDAFDGSRLEVELSLGVLKVLVQQTGMLRPLELREVSDGTLRFLLTAAACLSPRPGPLTVFNEPEASLNRRLIPQLARLLARAAEDRQVIVVSHDRALVTALLDAGAGLVELDKAFGETELVGGDAPAWTWPRR